MVGTALNHYRITKALGSGGMGEVYAAEDTKLHRHVAVKVLPAAVAAYPEWRQRFEREAHAIAALNHPNIVTIYSIEQAGDTLFLTMELVQGRPLSQLIPPRGLPLDRFLTLSIPLADAVSAAHQHGVIHRDLKPANIMVTDEGRVKVLDFGLARLKEGAHGAVPLSALPTEQVTGEGRVVGTVAYMSPEQADGRSVDHRSDIFSLGIVLYEMATGERPFKGDTTVSIISAILKDPAPPITAVNPALPGELARIIRHSLAKDAARRYQTTADLRNELEELKQDLESGQSLTPSLLPAAARPQIRTRWLLAGIGGALLGIAVLGYVIWGQFQPGSDANRPPTGVRTMFAQLTSQSGLELFPSLSPDGTWLVYASGGDIYLQSVGGQSAINLTKDSASRNDHPAFSPDGEYIAFRSERQGGGLFVMRRLGESPRRVTDIGFNPAWSPDGQEILYSTQGVSTTPAYRAVGGGGQLWAVKLSTGERRRVTSDTDAVQPAWSPHGQRIAYWGLARGSQRDIWTIAAAGGQVTAVTSDPALDWSPAWSPDGQHLYFASDRGGSVNLWRARIDEESGKVLGGFEPVTTPAPFVGHLSFAAHGRALAYASVDTKGNVAKISFDSTAGRVLGRPELVTHGSRIFDNPHPSPDGRWVTFDSAFSHQQEDIFISRTDGSDLVQLTNDAALDRFPRWSPDGKRIAFSSSRGGQYQIWTINPDGSGLQQLTRATSGSFHPVWSPDGSRMLYADNARVFIFDVERPWESQTPEALPPWNTRLRRMSWSPDGRWVTADLPSDEPGGIIVYDIANRSYDRLTDMGGYASWLADSQRLLFRHGAKLFLVDRTAKIPREIFRLEGSMLLSPKLSLDNRTIYFQSFSQQADIWMLTLK